MKKVTFRERAPDKKSAFINPTSHNLSAKQPNDCNEIWDGLNRWKANVGSASSRHFRQSRRLILRHKSKRQLSADVKEKESTYFCRSKHVLIDLGDDEDGSTASETSCSTENLKNEHRFKDRVKDSPEIIRKCTTSPTDISPDRRFRKEDSSKLNEDKTSQESHNKKRGIQFEGKELNDESSSPPIEVYDSISNDANNDHGSSESQHQSTCDASSHDASIAEIKVLERFLDEQEQEIIDLEIELDNIHDENGEINEELGKKRRSLRCLEDKFTDLKTQLAEACSDEDDLNYEFTRILTARDNQTVNLTNEIDQMQFRVEKMERENKYYLRQLEKAEKNTQQKERRLSNTLSDINLLKDAKRCGKKREKEILRQKQLGMSDNDFEISTSMMNIFLDFNNDDELSLLSM